MCIITANYVLSCLLVFCLISGCSSEVTPVNLPQGINIFVSPTSIDRADRSFERPFQSLQCAKLEVRALKVVACVPITVSIRGGKYYLGELLHFTDEDSGTEAAPVTWQAYNGETVLLADGIRLSADKIQPVTDEQIRVRVSDESAREALVYIDLSGYLSEWPSPIEPNSDYDFASGGPCGRRAAHKGPFPEQCAKYTPIPTPKQSKGGLQCSLSSQKNQAWRSPSPPCWAQRSARMATYRAWTSS